MKRFDSRSHGRAAHKAAQLCRQASQALSLALADSSDDLLRELTVVSVDPAPDASRLLVTVAPAASSAAVSPVELLARLDAASGWLRREVASAITRKRAPELMFTLSLAPGQVVRP
jgi:ribosome-binding factor A